MMMKKHLIVVFFAFYSTYCCLADNVQWRGNILCLIGVPSASHYIWMRSIMLELVQRGYNLTVLTVEIDESQPNLHFITMENVYEDVQREWAATRGMAVNVKDKNPFDIVTEAYDFYHLVSQKITSTQGFRQLLNYPDNFEFSAILHDFTLGQVMLGFVEKFHNPPLISMSPFGAPPHTWKVAGESLLALFTPHFATKFPTEMHPWERIVNTGVHMWDWLYRKVIFMPREIYVARKFFTRVNLEALEEQTKLILINCEPLLDGGVPLPAHVVNVGGLHVTRDGWLPAVIEDVLSASKPVIYFALGSNMRSDLLDKEIISKFLQTFLKLSNFAIIWKYEGKRPSNWPRNVLTVEWVDQNRILEHPNLVLFITHGGLLSVQEAAWYGVPILGVPLFMDQHSNVAKSVARGLGLVLNINSFTAEELEEKILQIVQQKHFRETSRQLSRTWQLREHPLSRAISWISTIADARTELSYLKNQISFWKILLPPLLILLAGSFLLVKIFTIALSRQGKRRKSVQVQKKMKKK